MNTISYDDLQMELHKFLRTIPTRIFVDVDENVIGRILEVDDIIIEFEFSNTVFSPYEFNGFAEQLTRVSNRLINFKYIGYLITD